MTTLRPDVSTHKDDRGGDVSAALDCQSCGACCSYSAQWPRFSLESEAELARIPSRYINDAGAGMRCDGVRCAALIGTVGTATRCAVYSVRPQVCRACMPYDDECLLARRELGL